MRPMAATQRTVAWEVRQCWPPSSPPKPAWYARFDGISPCCASRSVAKLCEKPLTPRSIHARGGLASRNPSVCTLPRSAAHTRARKLHCLDPRSPAVNGRSPLRLLQELRAQHQVLDLV